MINVTNNGLDFYLQSANDSENPVLFLKDLLNKPFYRDYLEYSVSENFPIFDIDKIKWTDYQYHPSMSGCHLLNRHTLSMFKTVLISQTGSINSKALQCKSMLEMLSSAESKVLVAILTKNLQSLYPKLDFHVLNDALYN